MLSTVVLECSLQGVQMYDVCYRFSVMLIPRNLWGGGGDNNLLHPRSFDVDRGASLVLLFSLFFFIMRSSIGSSVSFSLSSRLLCRCTNQGDCWFSPRKKERRRTPVSVCGVADFSGRVAHVMMGISYCLELQSWMYSVHRKQLSTHAVVGGGGVIVCKIGRGKVAANLNSVLFFVMTSNSYLHSVALQSSVLQSAWTITLGGLFQCFDADVVEAGMAKWIPRNGLKIPEETSNDLTFQRQMEILQKVQNHYAM